MKYNRGDKFVLKGIECKVAFVNAEGHAYLSPVYDAEEYNGQKTYIGCVFTIIDIKGKDKLGNRAYALPINDSCGAV